MMTVYRVSIWTSYEVEASSEEEAEEKARDAVAGQEIPTRWYEFVAEETDHDVPEGYL